MAEHCLPYISPVRGQHWFISAQYRTNIWPRASVFISPAGFRHIFTRATLCSKRGPCCRAVSVCPSVPPVSEMTYTVSSGTLNSILYNHLCHTPVLCLNG